MRVALAVPLEDEQRLTRSADHHGHAVVAACSGGDELALRLGQHEVDVAIVAATAAHLTPSLVEAADLLGVRMVVVAADPDARRHARRLGIVDIVDGVIDWRLLDPAGTARGLHEPPASTPTRSADVAAGAREAAGPGVVIAVWGPHGAPGRTSIAIALAAQLAASGLRVVLADADTHAASVAAHLGMLDEAPGFAAACRLAGIGGLDGGQFERIAVPHRASGGTFHVLSGIARPSRWPELGAERVTGVLAAARAHFEVVVVDVAASLEQHDGFAVDTTAPGRNDAGLAVLRGADRVLALAAADAVGVARFIRGRAELAELTAADRVVVAVNKVRASVVGFDPGGQVRQTLARFGGVPDASLIPWDPSSFDAALLAARPLPEAAPRSASATAVRQLAQLLVPHAAAAGARWPRRRRIA